MRGIMIAGMLAAGGALPLCAQAGTVGIVGGFVSSNISVSTGSYSGQSARSGFAIGLSLRVPAGALQFAPEVMYVEKGATDTTDAGFGNLKLGYVEVPILVRYSFPTSSRIHPFLTVGPTVSTRVSCTISVTVAGSGTSTTSDQCNDSDNLRSTDAGVMFGGGVSGRRLSLSVRYELGMVNLSKDDTSPDFKNRALFVLAGLSF
ncbi:MAG TPA: porin family protein [Gemmatimonadales bacterium]|jgi:hypothetical protein